MKRFFGKLKQARLFVLAGITALLVGGAYIGFSTMSSSAAQCDSTNIVYCGLTGENATALKSQYTSSRDTAGHTDIRRVMQWGGFTDANIASASDSNVKIGWLTRDGVIKVNGVEVGRGTVVTTRWSNNGTRPSIGVSGVYSRSASANELASEKVLVLFDGSGKAVASLIIRCGNVLKFTPVIPKQPSLVCSNLTVTPTGKARENTLSATAKAVDTAITSYVFYFGDGTYKTVMSSASSVSLTHTYGRDGQAYTAKVYVNGTDHRNVTDATKCTVSFKTPEAPKPPVVPPKTPETPKVEIVKTVEGVEHKSVGLNTEFTYQVKVKNTGNVVLKSLALSDTPQAGVTLLSVGSNLGTIENNVWKYTLPELKVGESRDFTLKAKVPTYKAGSLKNTVCVDTPTIPGGPDDCDDATVEVPKVDEVRVCEISTKTILNVPKTDENNPRYTSVDSPLCKEEEPVVTPPASIPSTGPTELILSMAGVGSLTGAGYYWRSSRREFINKMLGR